MKLKYDNEEFDVQLIDDGTLDTVISVNGIVSRFDGDFTASYRKPDGSMTLTGLKQLAIETIETDDRFWDGGGLS